MMGMMAGDDEHRGQEYPPVNLVAGRMGGAEIAWLAFATGSRLGRRTAHVDHRYCGYAVRC